MVVLHWPGATCATELREMMVPDWVLNSVPFSASNPHKKWQAQSRMGLRVHHIMVGQWLDHQQVKIEAGPTENQACQKVEAD